MLTTSLQYLTHFWLLLTIQPYTLLFGETEYAAELHTFILM